jgi:hypothetical protein
MEYNTAQTKLVNGEYGRHIQKMIEDAIKIEDRASRNQQAKAIVRSMSYFSTGSKDTEDYWNKLWDQLFVISNFKLDVDSPFPKPQPEIENRPKPLKYPKRDIRFRPYGVCIEDVINKVVSEEDSLEKEQTVANIANHLKRQYLNWNRDSVNDTLIHEHLDTLSHGKLKMQENFQLNSTRAILTDLALENAINNPKPESKKRKKKNNNPVAGNPNNNKPNGNNNPNNNNKFNGNNNHKSNINNNNNKPNNNNNNYIKKKNIQKPNQPKINTNTSTNNQKTE